MLHGEKFGSSTYLQRCEHFCGGHAQTVYQRGTTCAVGKSKSRQRASFVARNLKQLLIFFGNARSQEMYGGWAVGVYRKAAMMWLIFSCSSNTCKKRWSHQSWIGGQSRRGVFGMHEIATTSSMFSHSHDGSWKVQ